jgi:hypothetical protein
VAPLGELVVSLWRPIFLDRSLIWISIPFYPLIATGIKQLRQKAVVAVVAAVVAVNFIGIRNYHVGYQKEAWDQSASYVAEHAKPEDLILLSLFSALKPA